MKVLGWTAALSLILMGWAGSASADPWKDESGNGRWRSGYERSYDGPRRGYGYGYERPRRERRAFKQEFDDGRCKVERKWERNGEYKEGYCQVDAEWTKLAWTQLSGRPGLLDEGTTGRIAPGEEGAITSSSVLTGRETMTVELEVVVDRGVSGEELLRMPG
jgi:hypothetical protein